MTKTRDCAENDGLDQLMLKTIDERQMHSTLIVCFFTGAGMPPHCSAMLRVPAPAVGSRVTDDFHLQIDAAIELNAAVHDGAVIAGRDGIAEPYCIRGWSYRLFPPCNVRFQEKNRGSAFNSALAMSMIVDIDAIYLSSNHSLSKFQHGSHYLLR